MSKREEIRRLEKRCDAYERTVVSHGKSILNLHAEKRELKKQLDEKDREIKRLKEYNDGLQKIVDRQNQQLTEQDLYAKKKKETTPTGVPAIDATVDRLLKLEAKFEANGDPYFF